MATLSTITENGVSKFGATINIAKQQGTIVNLSTNTQYVDKDIKLTLNVRSATGTIGGTTTANGKAAGVLTNVNSVNTISNLSGKTAGTDYWQIKATATGTNASYKPKYTVSQSGWINSTIEASSAVSIAVDSDTTGQSIYIPKATLKWNNNQVLVNTAGYLKVNDNDALLTMSTVNPQFTGGGLTVSSSMASSPTTNSCLTLSDTDSCGAYITSTGSAGRAKVTYNGNYVGYINKSNGDTALAATSSNTTQGTPTKKYINGIKIFAPSSGTRTFDITVPNGNTTDFITFRFSVDSSGNVAVDGIDE